MTLLLDTSVLVGTTNPVDEPFAISVISLGELHAGVLLASDPGRRAARLDRLTRIVESVDVLPADGPVASAYGRLRAATGRRPSNDLWIAATALTHDLTLVTADERLAMLPGVRSRLVTTSAD